MNLQSAASSSPTSASGRLRLSGVKLHHLRGAAAIAAVLPLREEIDLSVHAAAGPEFESVEKKETK